MPTSIATANSLIIRQLKEHDYLPVWKAMQDFTDKRNENTTDEIWLVEHAPIYTLGQSGKKEHILNPGKIPVLHVDRGGQVTYHGPGQLVAYVLIDIKRKHISIRRLVTRLEQAVITLLAEYHIKAQAKPTAPGIYINEAKIGSIGLRVRRGCSFHGLALNVNMDLEPFAHINPCGYAGLAMTQLKDFMGDITIADIAPKLIQHLARQIGYNQLISDNIETA